MPDRPTSTPGFYKSRLARGGPWVPIKVWLEDGDRDEAGELMSDQILRGTLGDKPFDPLEPNKDGRTFDFRDFAEKIDKTEFDRLLAAGRDATNNDSERPEARPYEGIDLNRMRPVF